MSAFVAQDDAARTASIANLFHNVVDVLAGINTAPNPAAGWMRADGTIGPVNSDPTLYVGADGQLYRRGTTAGNAPAAAASAGFVITPMMIMLGVGALLILKR